MSEKMKVKEIEEFGTRITIFENGDVYVSTKRDIHAIRYRYLFSQEGFSGENKNGKRYTV